MQKLDSIQSRRDCPILLIIPVNLRLKLILVRSNRSRAAHSLQLTLHIVINMILGISVRSTTPATGPTTRTTTLTIIIQDGRRSGCNIAGVEVTPVPDGASSRRATNRRTARAARSSRTGEDIVEVVRRGGEGRPRRLR